MNTIGQLHDLLLPLEDPLTDALARRARIREWHEVPSSARHLGSTLLQIENGLDHLITGETPADEIEAKLERLNPELTLIAWFDAASIFRCALKEATYYVNRRFIKRSNTFTEVQAKQPSLWAWVKVIFYTARWLRRLEARLDQLANQSPAVSSALH